MQETPKWIVVAHLIRTQGRKGEILADLLTDFPDRFTRQPLVYLAPPDFNGPAEAADQRSVADFWLPTGRNSGRIVLLFTDVDSINKAETLLGRDVLVPWQDRTVLDEDASYIHDLIGCKVYDGDHLAGLVEDVQYAASSDGADRDEDSPPMLVVRSPDGKEILIPYVKDFLVSLDLEQKAMHMRLPAGLLELNT